MRLCRPLAHHEGSGNLPIAPSLGHQRRHFAFACGEAAIPAAGYRLMRERLSLRERGQGCPQEMLSQCGFIDGRGQFSDDVTGLAPLTVRLVLALEQVGDLSQ